MKECLRCFSPTPSYRMSRSSGPTKGFCLTCADEYRVENPTGFTCAGCEQTLPRIYESTKQGAEGFCRPCANQQTLPAKVKRARYAPLPPHKLVEFRAKYGMTQAGFATAVCVSVPAVSSWETGKTAIPRIVQLAMSAFMAGLPPYNG